jgi:hypothetical protein
MSGVRAVIAGNTLLGPIGYAEATGYRSLVPGRYNVRIDSDLGEVCARMVSLTRDRSEAVVAAPARSDSGNDLIVVPMSSTPPGGGSGAWVIFVNAAAESAHVDIAVNSIVAAQDLAPDAYSDPVRVSPGSCDIRAVVSSGSGVALQPVADSAAILDRDDRYICVLMGGRGEPTVFRTYPDR